MKTKHWWQMSPAKWLNWFGRVRARLCPSVYVRLLFKTKCSFMAKFWQQNSFCIIRIFLESKLYQDLLIRLLTDTKLVQWRTAASNTSAHCPFQCITVRALPTTSTLSFVLAVTININVTVLINLSMGSLRSLPSPVTRTTLSEWLHQQVKKFIWYDS